MSRFARRTLPVAGALLILAGSVGGAAASSHREAPLISKDAFADTTDTYAFISPSNPNNVVIAASWIPFEGPRAARTTGSGIRPPSTRSTSTTTVTRSPTSRTR